jgi:hypothetical protein
MHKVQNILEQEQRQRGTVRPSILVKNTKSITSKSELVQYCNSLLENDKSDKPNFHEIAEKMSKENSRIW